MSIIPFDSSQVEQGNGDPKKLAVVAETSVGANGHKDTVPLQGDPSTASGSSPPNGHHDPYPLYPESLKIHPAFVGWNPQTFDKKPKNLRTGGNACSDIPSTWSSYEHAKTQVCSTVGLGREVLEGDGYVDMDLVRDPETGVIEPWALAVVKELNSYTEISPSKTGLHIYTRYVWTREKNQVKEDRPNGKTLLVRGVTKHEGIELYGRTKAGKGQYFTVSGLHLEGTPLTVETRDLSSLIERVQNLSVFGTPSEAPQKKSSITLPSASAGENDNNSVREAGWIRTIIEKVKVGNQVDSFRVERIFRDDYAIGTPGHKHRSDPQKWDESRNYKGESVTYLRYSILNMMEEVGVTELGTEAVLEEWIPKPLAGELPPIGRCSTKVLPFFCRDYVADIQERMSVPLEFPVMAVVLALAGAIGRRAFVQPKAYDTTWVEALNLWRAIIASPGTLKSPVMGFVLKTLDDIEKKWSELFADEERIYKAKLADYEDKAAEAKKHHRDFKEPPPVEPVRKRLVTNDATHQKLHETMADNPGGILLHCDELSGWFEQLDMKGREGSRGFQLKAWNGNSSHTLETVGRGVITAIICESLCGNFQPKTAREYLQNQDKGDGMFQRLQILFYPDPASYRNVDRLPNYTAMKLMETVLFFLANLPVAKTPVAGVVLRFDSVSQPRSDTWHADLERKIRAEKDSLKAEHLGKYRGLMPTLAAIYQLADIVAKLPSETKSENFRGNIEIDLEHTEQSIATCALLESHLDRIYSFRKNPALQAARDLAGHIQKGDLKEEIDSKGGFTVRDVTRHEFSGLVTSGLVQAALEELEDRDWVHGEEIKTGKRGRPTTLWVVNPKVFEVPDTDLSDI